MDLSNKKFPYKEKSENKENENIKEEEEHETNEEEEEDSEEDSKKKEDYLTKKNLEKEIKEAESKIKIVIKKHLPLDENILIFSYSKIFISYNPSKNFENPNLKGVLCIVSNRTYTNFFLYIYDLLDFKKQFELELYTNIEEGYSVLSPTFHVIEYPTFFIGMQFPDENSANQVRDCILIYSSIIDAKSEQFVFETQNKKLLSYKPEIKNFNQPFVIEKIEQLLTLNYDSEEDDLVYDLSRGAIKYFEKFGISAADFNYEYENIRDRIKNEKEMREEAEEEEENEDQLKQIVKENEEKEKQERIENILQKVSKLDSKEEEEEEEINLIKQSNKIKKKNLGIKPEKEILTVTLLPSKKFSENDGYSEGSVQQEDNKSVFSKVSKISKRSKNSKYSKMSSRKLQSFKRISTFDEK